MDDFTGSTFLDTAKALFPDFSYFTLFLPMAIVLAIRPTGLFGVKRA